MICATPMSKVIKTLSTPAGLPNLELWLEVDFIVSPPAVGADVTLWDEMVFGRNPVQGTASLAPHYNVAPIGQLPSVRYDGIDDCMTIPDFTYKSYTTGLYCFAVVRSASTSDTRATILSQFNASGDQRAFRFYKTEATNLLTAQISQDGTTTTQKQHTTTAALVDDTTYLLEFHLNILADSLEIFIDRKLQAVTLGQNDTLTSVFNSTEAIGVGCQSDLAQTWDNDIAAIVFGSSSLTPDQKRSMRYYFSRRYGV